MRLEQINSLTKKAYERTAGKYHESFKNEIEQKDFDRMILEKFSGLLMIDSVICDAGCGPSAHIGKYLSDLGHKIVGIDISKRCIDIASSYVPEIDFKVMDMMNTDFPDDYFDGIVSFYSIIHTPKEYINNIFAELNRILKPEGKLLIVVKKGIDEGITDDDWYEGNKIYFTYFLENEIRDFFVNNNYSIDFIETRKPYCFEINVERIYAIGSKKVKLLKEILK